VKSCPGPDHRPLSRRDCARDSVTDVDPMRIDVQIGDHSELPLEHWREQIKEKRRKRGPRSRKPATPGQPPAEPGALIDDYAVPRSRGVARLASASR